MSTYREDWHAHVAWQVISDSYICHELDESKYHKLDHNELCLPIECFKRTGMCTSCHELDESAKYHELDHIVCHEWLTCMSRTQEVMSTFRVDSSWRGLACAPSTKVPFCTGEAASSPFNVVEGDWHVHVVWQAMSVSYICHELDKSKYHELDHIACLVMSDPYMCHKLGESANYYEISESANYHELKESCLPTE